MNEKKITKEPVYLSPNQKAWRRLKRNKSAIVGMLIIFIAIFLAVFAYALAPDRTPDANDQILEIRTEEPGFEVLMLKRRKDQDIKQKWLLSWLIGGQESQYENIPIKSYDISAGNIVVDRYTGDDYGMELDTFSLAEIVYPLNTMNNEVQLENGEFVFQHYDGSNIRTSISEIKQQVTDDHLKKRRYLLGTDKFGRDNLSRLLLGVRVSLSVGLIAILVSLLIGITLGALAGYYRGWVDDVIMYIINVFWSVPLLLWVFALVIIFQREYWLIFVAVGLVMWVEVARIVRGQFFSLREKDFVEASKSLGFSNARTIFKHILPNTVGPIIVITAANFASAIIIEAGLSFLGIGVQPPKPSWGGILHEYYKYIGTSKSFLAILPGVCILILTLGFNLVGNGIRDALDVRSTN